MAKIIGVSEVEVNLERKEVIVDYDKMQVTVGSIANIIEEAGFKVRF